MADAVIVLANLMDARGVLNDESVLRLKAGVECFKSRAAESIVTSGWAYRPDSETCIGVAMAHYLVHELCVPSSRIKTDLSARDTVGDALFTKINVVVPNAWSSLVVVTSDYHCQRTQEIFSFIYGKGYKIEVVGVETSPTPEQIANEANSLDAFRKTFESIKSGNTEHILDELTKTHPYYNGKIFPKVKIG